MEESDEGEYVKYSDAETWLEDVVSYHQEEEISRQNRIEDLEDHTEELVTKNDKLEARIKELESQLVIYEYVGDGR
jgi:cell division protein FtsB